MDGYTIKTTWPDGHTDYGGWNEDRKVLERYKKESKSLDSGLFGIPRRRIVKMTYEQWSAYLHSRAGWSAEFRSQRSRDGSRT